MTARLLLPDFRSPVGYETRFAGRLFRVVYTSQATRQRAVLPPPHVTPLTFREAASVVLDVRTRSRDWPAGEQPAVVSVDGKTPIRLYADDVLDVWRMASFLASTAGLELKPPPAPPLSVPTTDDADEDY